MANNNFKVGDQLSQYWHFYKDFGSFVHQNSSKSQLRMLIQNQFRNCQQVEQRENSKNLKVLKRSQKIWYVRSTRKDRTILSQMSALTQAKTGI